MEFNERVEAANKMTNEVNRSQIRAIVTAASDDRGGFVAMLSNEDIPHFEKVVSRVINGYTRTGHRTNPPNRTATLYFTGTGLATKGNS